MKKDDFTSRNSIIPEEQIVSALTSFIASKGEFFKHEVFSKWFSNRVPNESEIHRTWDLFFSLIDMTDTDLEGLKPVKLGILNALSQYYDIEGMNFSGDKSYDVALLEGSIKCVLNKLDKEYYTAQRIDKNFSIIDKCVKELKKRASYPAQNSFFLTMQPISSIF